MKTRLMTQALAGLAVALAVLIVLDLTVSTPDASEPGPRLSSEELHRLGGVPRGWKFSLPAGDAGRGRQLFADLECYTCHEIKGQTFPAVTRDDKNVGPELTGMGGHHPAEYFAESVLAPNAVIVTGPGYTGPDGRSIMPSFADSLSVSQLVDLVAFLKSQTSGDAQHHDDAAEREQVAGDYRVRLVYTSPQGHPPGHGHQHGAGHGAGGHHDPGHHGAGQHGAGQPAPGHGPGHAGSPGASHLMAFIVDRDTGEPIPYLGVTAIIHAAGRPPRSIGLAPSIGERGFHYGAEVTLPPQTEKIALAIAPTTMQVLPASGSRYKSPVSIVFDWDHR